MILIIEDDPVMAGVMSAALQRRSLTHVIAGTAVDGYERAARTTPELVICDLGLPDIDGLHLIARLRALPRMASVPVIVCTSDTSRASVQKAVSVGACDYLAKPIDIDHFDERVLRALGRPRAASA